jgi:hypothetical protein
MNLRQGQASDTIDNPYVLSDAIADGSTASTPWLFQDVAESTGGTDWTLSNCCDEYEKLLIALVPSYLFLILILWNTVLMKPMKLIAVFVHEMSHATACWLTCGKVEGIEVHLNEGGVTKYRVRNIYQDVTKF